LSAIRRSAQSTGWLVVVLCLLAGTRAIASTEPADGSIEDAAVPLEGRAISYGIAIVPGIPAPRVAPIPFARTSAFRTEAASLYTDEALAKSADQLPGAESAQAIMRFAVDTILGECLGLDTAKCRADVAVVFNRMQTSQLTAGMWADFKAVRNNMYFYVVAPSLLLAKNILRTKASCAEWDKQARDVAPLAELLRNAGLELGQRQNLSERKELEALNARYKGCSTI
jgi:hypothetical protein